MVKKLAQQAMDLTRKILESYWAGNMELLAEHMHPDILWIGSMDSEYIRGAEEMRKRLEENQQAMPPCHLEQQEYEVASNVGGTCVVAGRYTGYTDPGAEIMLSEKQRVTFVWVHEKEKLWIRHIHLSNTLHIQEEDERFPTKAGEDTYRYLQRVLADRDGGEQLRIKDCMGVMRILDYSDICFIRADHNYCLVRSMGYEEEIRVRKNISGFAKELPEKFVMVSRSCCVNMDYAQSLDGRSLRLLEGTEISIPEKRLADIKKLVLQK